MWNYYNFVITSKINMNKSTDDIRTLLIDAGVKPSLQRMVVANFLNEHHCHPTVDEIYSALQPAYPTLSRTTVYNTVKILTDAGCIQALTLDGDCTRYDFDTSPHGHFLCQKCGMVFDVPIMSCPPAPEGFEVHTSQLSFRGVCPSCQKD